MQDLVHEETVILLTDPSPVVKKALLSEMARLCVFFGRQKTNDVLLSHMITYLNDDDWTLRSAFCEAIVGVGTFVGSRSLEEFILPLMVQAFTGFTIAHSIDSEEFVVEKVLNSLASLAEIGLIQKKKVKELFVIIIPLLCHPNIWIRMGKIIINSSRGCLCRGSIKNIATN